MVGSGIVEFEKRDGTRLAKRIDKSLGTRGKSMTSAQLRDKFADCAKFTPGPVDVDRIVATVDRLKTLPDLSQLVAAL